MKNRLIGMIGGKSPESTAPYYLLINQIINKALGHNNCANMILVSLNFQDIVDKIEVGDWAGIASELEDEITTYMKDCEIIIIGTNTLHKVVPLLKPEIRKRILHIAEATAKEIEKKEYHKVALIGTLRTMEDGFYSDILNQYGIEVIIPEAEDRQVINHIIFDELCKNRIKKESKIILADIIRKLKDCGAEALVLGCTELPLLINEGYAALPVINTLEIHAQAAARLALRD